MIERIGTADLPGAGKGPEIVVRIGVRVGIVAVAVAGNRIGIGIGNRIGRIWSVVFGGGWMVLVDPDRMDWGRRRIWDRRCVRRGRAGHRVKIRRDPRDRARGRRIGCSLFFFGRELGLRPEAFALADGVFETPFGGREELIIRGVPRAGGGKE